MVNKIDRLTAIHRAPPSDPIRLVRMVNKIDRLTRALALNLLHHPGERDGVGTAGAGAA
jgi:hypothetical protein